MTDSVSFMMLALWSRVDAPVGIAPPADSPEWTRRPPGLNGYDHWRYGYAPYFPAMEHEFCHGFYPNQLCGH
jgi:hypothetical protein